MLLGVTMMVTVAGAPVGDTATVALISKTSVNEMKGKAEFNQETCWYDTSNGNTCHTPSRCVKPKGDKWLVDKRGMRGCEIDNNSPCGGYGMSFDCPCTASEDCPAGAPYCENVGSETYRCGGDDPRKPHAPRGPGVGGGIGSQRE